MGQNDAEIVLVGLSALENILNKGDTELCKDLIDKCGGLTVLEALQKHSNLEIYRKALVILEKHYDLEANEDQMLIDTITEYRKFEF